jgi:putative drug exporter of the RND superfamily
MRRFATWTTGHRKTVIFGWIAALIVIGTIAGMKGAEFSEEFKLPTSDSTEAYELLENNFPQQSGGTSQIVYKAAAGVESPQVKQKMESVFKSVEKEPHVTEVASPYKSGGASGISKDGKIAYATIQYDVQSI